VQQNDRLPRPGDLVIGPAAGQIQIRHRQILTNS
jgi:hypothetical protein